MVKPRLYNDEDKTKAAALWTLKTVLINALKLLHPYMPFITEEIFCNVQNEEESIMISKWPEYKDEWNFEEDEKAVELIKEAVRGIRNTRTGMNVPPSRKAKVFVVSESEDAVSVLIHQAALYMPFADLVDIDKEIERLTKEEDKMNKEIKRAQGMLSNPKFVDKAPADKVQAEKDKLEKYTQMLAQIQERLAALK